MRLRYLICLFYRQKNIYTQVDTLDSRINMLQDGSLNVDDSVQLDAGHYVVEAQNAVGRTTAEFEVNFVAYFKTTFNNLSFKI